mgnify:CR=1 FL=1
MLIVVYNPLILIDIITLVFLGMHLGKMPYNGGHIAAQGGFP